MLETTEAAIHLLNAPIMRPEVRTKIPVAAADEPSITFFAPVVMFPEVNVKVLVEFTSFVNDNPVELFKVKFLTVVGKPFPVICPATPL